VGFLIEVGNDNIEQAVAIDVSHIGSHPGKGRPSAPTATPARKPTSSKIAFP
jgi:hypothetical protein